MVLLKHNVSLGLLHFSLYMFPALRVFWLHSSYFLAEFSVMNLACFILHQLVSLACLVVDENVLSLLLEQSRSICHYRFLLSLHGNVF